MKELKKRVENNEYMTSDELCQAILMEGIKDARFIVKMHDNNMLCRVDERFNREVRQNYKLVLVPVEPNENMTVYGDFYTTDMVSLIENDSIKIVA